MKKVRLGILGAADIAERRFLPALKKCENLEFAALAIATMKERNILGNTDVLPEKSIQQKLERGNKLVQEYGGELITGYEALINNASIDAVYIPLPPAYHYYWARKALNAGKHVLLEKPFTTNYNHSKELIDMAEKRNLAVCENYGFVLHEQMNKVRDVIKDGSLGKVRLLRTAFGFPRRNSNDFRYKKELGGGALLDCGGYTLKMAQNLFGKKLRILSTVSEPMEGFDVDGFGAITVVNDNAQIAQLSFGMEYQYKCELEIWGTEGALFADRIYTAPPGYKAGIVVRKGTDIERYEMEDDQFEKIILEFYGCIINRDKRLNVYDDILAQSRYLQDAAAY